MDLLRLALPLGLAAAGTLFLAGPVILWLFGPLWAPAAPVLQALVGVVVGSSIFAVYKKQMLAEERGASFLLSRTLHLGALAIGPGYAFCNGGAADLLLFLQQEVPHTTHCGSGDMASRSSLTQLETAQLIRHFLLPEQQQARST